METVIESEKKTAPSSSGVGSTEFERNLLHIRGIKRFIRKKSKHQTSNNSRSVCVCFVYASFFLSRSILLFFSWIEYFIRPITISFHLLRRVGICFIPVWARLTMFGSATCKRARCFFRARISFGLWTARHRLQNEVPIYWNLNQCIDWMRAQKQKLSGSTLPNLASD